MVFVMIDIFLLLLLFLLSTEFSFGGNKCQGETPPSTILFLPYLLCQGTFEMFRITVLFSSQQQHLQALVAAPRAALSVVIKRASALGMKHFRPWKHTTKAHVLLAVPA